MSKLGHHHEAVQPARYHVRLAGRDWSHEYAGSWSRAGCVDWVRGFVRVAPLPPGATVATITSPSGEVRSYDVKDCGPHHNAALVYRPG